LFGLRSEVRFEITGIMKRTFELIHELVAAPLVVFFREHPRQRS